MKREEIDRIADALGAKIVRYDTTTRPATPREKAARNVAREIMEFLDYRRHDDDGGHEALAHVLGVEFGPVLLERLRVHLAVRNARARMRR